jgi:CheY-like chemotaxis protein
MSASQALALAQDQPFDVVVSDVGLPDASGYELMKELREKHAMKGIAITGTSGEEARGREAGFGAQLTKPVSVRRIEQAIAELDL